MVPGPISAPTTEKVAPAPAVGKAVIGKTAPAAKEVAVVAAAVQEMSMGRQRRALAQQKGAEGTVELAERILTP